MFTRELPFASAIRLWDGLFAMLDQMDNLIECICVALLLRIRQLRKSYLQASFPVLIMHTVIPEDYGSILTLLLRYPAGSIDLPLDTPLILVQALQILRSPTAATGAAIALANHHVLGIQPLNQDSLTETMTPSASSTYRGKRMPSGLPRSRASGTSSPAKTYGFESFTRGLIDRAQASGE